MNTKQMINLIEAYNKRFGFDCPSASDVFSFVSTYIDPDSMTNRLITGEDIVNEASLFTQITKREIEGRTRKREVVFARFLISFSCRNETNLSLNQIGALMGNLNHATILHHVQTLSDLMDTEPETKKKVIDFTNHLRNKYSGKVDKNFTPDIYK